MNQSTFIAKVKSVMLDNKYDRSVNGFRSGKLDTRSLYKIKMTEKLFKRKVERKGKQYSITLAVDCSGSMHRGKVEPTLKAVRMLADAFKLAKIDFEVVAFNVLTRVIKQYGKPLKKTDNLIDALQSVYDSTDELAEIKFCYVCKRLWNSKDLKFGLMHDDSCANKRPTRAPSTIGNCDGEVIYDVRKEMAKHTGGKIVIMLSDGKPAFDIGMDYWSYQNPKMKYQDYNLKRQVELAIEEGIVFIGVGILTSAVKEFYPAKNTVVLQNVDKIYEWVVEKLSTLIKRE